MHRSYIVSLAKVKAINNKKVQLPGVEFPIGDGYLVMVHAWIKR
ncbi:hypothetical protein F0L74_27135 [Chitinophaga agrisoli]|uniref:Uncharacterized protein n=1 Tax=Chitinophaga agrisoli TaxID=2607653 RepID=A0A5B2VRX2_9BACT|nr:hypothetical protein F0L74_27135 [Chitinophaga agrisoli]